MIENRREDEQLRFEFKPFGQRKSLITSKMEFFFPEKEQLNRQITTVCILLLCTGFIIATIIAQIALLAALQTIGCTCS